MAEGKLRKAWVGRGAVLFASLSSSPVSALSLNIHEARTSPNHGELARRMSEHKRVKRCKPRTSPPATAPASTSSAAPKPTSSSGSDPAPAPAPPKSSPKPKPKPAPPASSPGGLCPGKKMLAWGSAPNVLGNQWNNMAQLIYTWGATTSSDVAQYNVKACSMLWGEKNVQDFKNKVVNSDAKVDCALHVNEPEIPSQANMSPQRAADLWVENMIPLKQNKGTILGAPAVTSDIDNAMKWMDAFFAACADRTGSKTCQADFQPLHYYDLSADGFKSFLGKMHGKYGLPIMVTEFADHSFNGQPQANMDQVWGFATEMKAFFDSTDYIACYAPFGAIPKDQLPDINKDNAIMGDNNLPTDLGWFYYGN